MLIALGYSTPFKLKSQSRMEYFNETMILVCVYHYFLFTAFVDDPETRYLIGFSLIACACFNVVVNMISMIASAILTLVWSFKKARYTRRFKAHEKRRFKMYKRFYDQTIENFKLERS